MAKHQEHNLSLNCFIAVCQSAGGRFLLLPWFRFKVKIIMRLAYIPRSRTAFADIHSKVSTSSLIFPADPNTCSNYSGSSDVLLLLQLITAADIGSQKMSMFMQCFNSRFKLSCRRVMLISCRVCFVYRFCILPWVGLLLPVYFGSMA